MAYTVVIDPGHGGSDPGAVYGERAEKNDVLNLALAIGNILEENGVNIQYTRTTDVYNTPYEKAMMGNNAGADLFLSIHRDSVPTPNSATGVSSLVYSDEGIKAELARNINRNLESVGFQNNGVVNRPNLVVLKRTQMPAVLAEVGFINNEQDNALFDNRFNDIAKAIADGVLETLGITPNQEETPSQMLYRVQVGAFANPENAEDLQVKLQNEGYPSFIVLNNGLYKVQVGAFRVLDNAVQMENALRNRGYNTFIVSAI